MRRVGDIHEYLEECMGCVVTREKPVKYLIRGKGMVLHMQSSSNCRIGCWTIDKIFTVVVR
jgi:rhamnose utilization protein RhaD (predicted bifunctional aldolase and dehydrogenase)